MPEADLSLPAPHRRRPSRATRRAGVVLVLALLVLAGCATSVSHPPAAHATASSSSSTGAQPGTLVYGHSTAGATRYAARGALVITSRINYHDPAFRTISAKGGSVLLYLDPVIRSAGGRYQNMLYNSSRCGGSVGRWPGVARANEYGYVADFRKGSRLQKKLPCVLRAMVRENPQMAGWFADDLGSRSWWPNVHWESWSASQQRAYRDGAIAMTRTFRLVADQYKLIFLVNGTWDAGSLKNNGGGYPSMSKPGNAWADGSVIEHHDSQVPYFTRYACSSQWATGSKVTKGRAVNYAITSTQQGLRDYSASRCISHVSLQPSYDSIDRPWAGFRDLGLPHKVS